MRYITLINKWPCQIGEYKRDTSLRGGAVARERSIHKSGGFDRSMLPKEFNDLTISGDREHFLFSRHPFFYFLFFSLFPQQNADCRIQKASSVSTQLEVKPAKQKIFALRIHQSIKLFGLPDSPTLGLFLTLFLILFRFFLLQHHILCSLSNHIANTTHTAQYFCCCNLHSSSFV